MCEEPVCVSKECGHGDGVGVDTKNTDRMSGVELREPRNLCVREIKERGHDPWGGCVYTCFSSDRYTKKSHQSHRK